MATLYAPLSDSCAVGVSRTRSGRLDRPLIPEEAQAVFEGFCRLTQDCPGEWVSSDDVPMLESEASMVAVLVDLGWVETQRRDDGPMMFRVSDAGWSRIDAPKPHKPEPRGNRISGIEV